MTRPPWYRRYGEEVHDPKIHQLSDRLYRFWSQCLGLASLNLGVVPPLDEVAFHLRKPAVEVKEMLNKLVSLELLDEIEGKLSPHNWAARQYTETASAQRMRRFRERRKAARDVTSDAHSDVTLHDGDCNVTRHVTHKRSVSVSVSGFNKNSKSETKPIPRAKEFAAFWARWCELTGRRQRESDACRAWLSVAHIDQNETIMLCLERYGASGEVARGAITNPDKWLFDQARENWTGDWPRLKSAAEIRSEALTRAIGDD